MIDCRGEREGRSTGFEDGNGIKVTPPLELRPFPELLLFVVVVVVVVGGMGSAEREEVDLGGKGV